MSQRSSFNCLHLHSLNSKKDDNTKMVCVCEESADGTFKFEDPLSWKWMAFRTAKQGGALIEFEKVLHNHREVMKLLNEY